MTGRARRWRSWPRRPAVTPSAAPRQAWSQSLSRGESCTERAPGLHAAAGSTTIGHSLAQRLSTTTYGAATTRLYDVIIIIARHRPGSCIGTPTAMASSQLLRPRLPSPLHVWPMQRTLIKPPARTLAPCSNLLPCSEREAHIADADRAQAASNAPRVKPRGSAQVGCLIQAPRHLDVTVASL
jgi:hypothetical protein